MTDWLSGSHAAKTIAKSRPIAVRRRPANAPPHDLVDTTGCAKKWRSWRENAEWPSGLLARTVTLKAHDDFTTVTQRHPPATNDPTDQGGRSVAGQDGCGKGPCARRRRAQYRRTGGTDEDEGQAWLPFD
jgi:hypothetical protein